MRFADRTEAGRRLAGRLALDVVPARRPGPPLDTLAGLGKEADGTPTT